MDKETLDKLNEYAKTLGMTIYRVDYGFEKDGKECIHGIVGLNGLSDKYYGFIGCTNPNKKFREN